MDSYKYQIGFKFVFNGVNVSVYQRNKVNSNGSIYIISDGYGFSGYVTEAQIDAAVAQNNSTKGEVNTEKKERTFTKKEVLEFVDYYVGDVTNFDVAFDEWITNKDKQADPEYQEYLRLKDKFRD